MQALGVGPYVVLPSPFNNTLGYIMLRESYWSKTTPQFDLPGRENIGTQPPQSYSDQYTTLIIFLQAFRVLQILLVRFLWSEDLQILLVMPN